MARHAVILATDPRLLAESGAGERRGLDYGRRVGGVPLVLRTAISARRAGAEHVHLIVGPGGGWLRARYADDPRLGGGVTWHLLDEVDEASVVAALARTIDRPFQVLRAARAFTVDTLKDLWARAGQAPLVSAMTDDAQGIPRESGLYVCDRVVLDVASREADALSPLEAALARMAGDGRRRKIDLPGRRVVALASPADVKTANDMLLRSLIKDHDGVVSKNVNRKISLALTRRTMDFDLWTPNVFTTIALLMGLASAALVATGSWALLALGGLLYQLSSIIDGNDGEIARLKFLGSRFGGWFDTVADDVTNLSFLLGLGYGAYMRSGHLGWFVFAALGVAMGVVTVAHLYAWLAGGEQTNTFDVPWEALGSEGGERTLLQRFFSLFLIIGKRDFYALLFMLLLLLGLVYVPLVLAATTTTVMGLLKLRESLTTWLSSPPPQPAREVTATGIRRR